MYGEKFVLPTLSGVERKTKNNPFQEMSAFAFDEVLLRLSFEILYPLVVTKPIPRFRT
jgi:hypothetical protein